MHRWLKCLAALAMSIALMAAPCKNCESKAAKADAQKCQHDCCPKPKPDSASCKWQPADYAAVEAKQEIQSAPQIEFVALTVELEATFRASTAAVAPQSVAELPPLYLTHQQFRN